MRGGQDTWDSEPTADALQQACYDDDRPTIELLLKKGADVNGPGGGTGATRSTQLHTRIVKLLQQLTPHRGTRLWELRILQVFPCYCKGLIP